MAERSTFSSDRELLAEGLLLDEIQEKRMIARFSVREHLDDQGEAGVFVFATGRIIRCSPDEAVELILNHRGSLETILKKGRPEGRPGKTEIATAPRWQAVTSIKGRMKRKRWLEFGVFLGKPWKEIDGKSLAGGFFG
jgi:hypothetical protein